MALSRVAGRPLATLRPCARSRALALAGIVRCPRERKPRRGDTRHSGRAHPSRGGLGGHAHGTRQRRGRVLAGRGRACGIRADMPTLAGAELPGSERPERQLMTARAGEPLQSFVAPGEAATPVSADRAPSASASSAAASRSRGAVQRVPTARSPSADLAKPRPGWPRVQDMIRSAQQKRSSGDNAIPCVVPEEAARRMFQEGSTAAASPGRDDPGDRSAGPPRGCFTPRVLVRVHPRPPDANRQREHDAEPTANVEQMAERSTPRFAE